MRPAPGKDNPITAIEQRRIAHEGRDVIHLLADYRWVQVAQCPVR